MGTPGRYRNLETESIVATIERLAARIEERFPGSGLGRVARELLDASREVQHKAAEIARPQTGLRLAVCVGIGVLGFLLVVVPFAADAPRSFEIDELVQVTEAGINILVILGGAILFLATTERRVRRGRALAAIHELRSLAHVVDMHQLAKDPQALEPGFDPRATSPERPMSAFELSRYLDYCTEMFSLIGKLAAVYTADESDPEIVAAVNEVESLTTGLSRKVWQKIMVLQSGLRPAHGVRGS
ncbi:MAG: hypothetical protein ACQGVC_22415 [Myxococcota bacterium]